jgi:hypothetical protein
MRPNIVKLFNLDYDLILVQEKRKKIKRIAQQVIRKLEGQYLPIDGGK